MALRPWHLLLVLAALAVPIQATALRGGGSDGGVAMAVSATLDHCGVEETGIVCGIGVSWTGVPGAERYSAAVTLADGSVHDAGTIGSGPGGGFTTIWVPYAGDGTYSVTVTAWGEDPDGKEKKISDQKSSTDAEPDGADGTEGESAKEEPEQQPAPEAGAGEPDSEGGGNGPQPGEDGSGQAPPEPGVSEPAPVEPPEPPVGEPEAATPAEPPEPKPSEAPAAGRSEAAGAPASP